MERMASGASVTVLASQAASTAVTEQMKKEYLAGWFEGAEGRGCGRGSDEFEKGRKDGQRYRFRKANGLERYAGPQWEKRLAWIKANRQGCIDLP